MVFRQTISASNMPTMIYNSFGDMDSWGFYTELAQCTDEGGEDVRMYNFLPYSGSIVNGINYIHIEKRFNDSSICYRYKFLILTEDWVNFYNIQGNFSKDVVNDGQLTDAELKANFMWFDHGNSVDAVNYGRVHVDQSNNVKCYHDGKVYYYDGGWQSVNENSQWQTGYITKQGKIYSVGLTGIDSYLKVNNNYGIGQRVTLYNLSDFYDGQTSSISSWPSNLIQIQKGRKTIMLVMAQNTEDGTTMPGTKNTDVLVIGIKKI